jgi:hypothetical protein
MSRGLSCVEGDFGRCFLQQSFLGSRSFGVHLGVGLHSEQEDSAGSRNTICDDCRAVGIDRAVCMDRGMPCSFYAAVAVAGGCVCGPGSCGKWSIMFHLSSFESAIAYGR